MFKKVITLAISLLLVVSSVSTAFGAQDTNSSSQKTKEQLVQEMLNDGLSIDDANYYADVSKMFDKWKDEGKVLDLANVKEDLSDEYVNSNPKDFRARILSGDMVAIKKAFFSQAEKNGQKDIQEYLKKNPNVSSVKIAYPDSSYIVAVGHTTKAVNKEDKGIQTNSWMPGPWNRDYDGGYDASVFNEPGSYATYFEEQTFSGTNYLKVKCLIDWTLTGYDINTWRARITNASGAASSVGLADIVFRNGVNHYNDTDLYDYAQAYYYADMNTKTAYTVGSGFSESFSTNHYYTQYSIIEITRAGALQFWWGFYD
ncbi:hypothetical protein [Desulfosporosinus sp. OT]|uniref:hypothetical protein n=1 Tax=Desulfosporosinus sp. OT TaxID=913865 RepID=UPI000223AD22|nr:hypothetical protein [Desulfosporosinus sp. OT]EGW41090.1 hypothetical protein DOT_0977 [Desulfosporosinus sp. OT]